MTSPASNDKPTCAICQEIVFYNQEKTVLNCNHTFHAICVGPWFWQGHDSCPDCLETVTKANGIAQKLPKPLNPDKYLNNPLLVARGLAWQEQLMANAIENPLIDLQERTEKVAQPVFTLIQQQLARAQKQGS